MAPASGDQQLAARRPPQSPMTDRSVRRRTPSPASRRYVLPDRYVPSRSIVFARDDYPNVYRPPPFPCRRDSRSPARCDDPTKASPMKGTPRRSRPATPPRDRPKARRPDIMLASRMSDNPRTDSWAESSRSRKYPGDSYRPSGYDSYRPSYDVSRHYIPRDPLSPLNGSRSPATIALQQEAQLEARAEVEVAAAVVPGLEAAAVLAAVLAEAAPAVAVVVVDEHEPPHALDLQVQVVDAAPPLVVTAVVVAAEPAINAKMSHVLCHGPQSPLRVFPYMTTLKLRPLPHPSPSTPNRPRLRNLLKR
ncbi:hypothetical protein AX14_007628 [Amanita brunnescens Koide BX004]|nr:hypothetical protein AX14_007628 [Amanita brunnescens Koide BX004]